MVMSGWRGLVVSETTASRLDAIRGTGSFHSAIKLLLDEHEELKVIKDRKISIPPSKIFSGGLKK